ncbi:MAG: T9SS type A sorting domain-containing protein [Vicingaceae bacterium]|nr:T9SS type A sorting domain-containing protein [Vicingaceae bacterium]
MKRILFILILTVVGSSSAYSMCFPTATCTSSYASTADAICNGPVITQDGACVTGDNTGSTACITGGCFEGGHDHSQIYYQFTATSTAVVIDFTSTGIQNADVALITNGVGGCGDPVSACPAVGSLCIESCFTTAGGAAASVNPTTLTIGETYIVAIESENNTDDGCGVTLGNDEGSFQICITTDQCRDGVMNGSETGVDCGGPDCGPCAATNDACADAINLTLDLTNAIGSGASNTCTQTLCIDGPTEDCYIATGSPPCAPGPGCCLVSYMSCGSVENNTWFTYTPPSTGTYNFALTNQSCTNGDGMQMWLGTMPSGCGDASTYVEDYCQSTATTADINYATTLTAGTTYYVSLDGFAGDDCTFDFGVYGSNPLPVELINFTGKFDSKKNTVLLDWKTASEINNDYFTIEKSYDGEIYEVIETVKGAGNSKNILDYKMNDNDVQSGTIYYKLKQTDFDGTVSNSGVVAVNVSGTGDIKLYPTATTDNVKLDLFIGAPTYTEVTVYNAVGVLVFQEKIELGRGKSSFVIPSADFDAGIYFVKVNGVDNVNGNTLKFIKN